MSLYRIAVIVIGRNEGARLDACLASMPEGLARIVYVDSGSTDGSVAAARAEGALVVELDPARPFTAARARNEGVAALAAAGHAPEYLQFIDGDCKLQKGYLTHAASALDNDKSLALVTGWRREINPDASIFNKMCEHEWCGPIGEITTCGGDMMVRASAFNKVGGFNPNVIAAEDDELCVRLRKEGWRLYRLPISMTQHDAHMLKFSQWWSRAIRTGHGFEQVNDLHPEYFVRERRRIWLYGGALPLVAIFSVLFYWPMLIFTLTAFAASYIRTALGLAKNTSVEHTVFLHAFYLMLSKFPHVTGAIIYRMRKIKGSEMLIIEYK